MTDLNIRATNVFNKNWNSSKKILLNRGGTRCLGKLTKVRMFDGSLKNVENVVVGDKLMGIDNKERNVLETTKGYGNLYKVKQTRGIDYVVNSNHILCVRQSVKTEKRKQTNNVITYTYEEPSDDIIDINVEDFFFKKSNKYRIYHTGFKMQGYDLPEKQITVDPYFLGLWLGDGTSTRVEIATADKEIIDYLYNDVCKREEGLWIKQIDKYTYTIRTKKLNGQSHLSKDMYKLGVMGNKHIPRIYLENSVNNRLKLLAGLIDSDGGITGRNTYSITQKNETIMKGIQELVRGLGFHSNGYHKHIAKMKRKDGTIYICDVYTIEFVKNDYSDIPLKLQRKKIYRISTKNYFTNRLSVEDYGEGEYYGFGLDGDCRFVLEDGTVTHNSSKTYSILQIIFVWLTTGRMDNDKHFKTGVLSIVRKYSATLNSTVIRDWEEIIVNQGYGFLLSDKHRSKGDKTYKFMGRMVEFFGADDEQKIRGRKRDILYCNEANELRYAEEFFQLMIRTQYKIIIDFNPDDEGIRINTELEQKRAIDKGDVEIIVSTYKDNPYLDTGIVEEIEYLGKTNPAYWRIYGLGEYGKVEGLVFPTWKEIDDLPDNYKFLGFGQDFGFTNDPTTVIGLYQIDNGIVLDEVIYDRGLTNQDIVKEYEKEGVEKTDEVIADSAEPKSIEEIFRAGYNIHPAEKGPDSIKFGINLMKEHNIFITARSHNLKKEFRTYSWKKDKNGNYIQVPIDSNNHCIDASRYVIMTKLKKRNKYITIRDDRRV